MAKGQQRSTKETKKPKKEVAKPVQTLSVPSKPPEPAVIPRGKPKT